MEALGLHRTATAAAADLASGPISSRLSCREASTSCQVRGQAGARWQPEIGRQHGRGARPPSEGSVRTVGEIFLGGMRVKGVKAAGEWREGLRFPGVELGQSLRRNVAGIRQMQPGWGCPPVRALKEEGGNDAWTGGMDELGQAEGDPIGAVDFGSQGALRLEEIEESTAGEEKKGTILGAVALITGTSVGAGILALPAETAPAGFVPSAAVLGICWAFLTLEALLLAEVNVALLARQPRDKAGQRISHSEVISLRTMAELTLGPTGGFLAGTTYLFLSYTLLVAYISKTAEVISFVSQTPSWIGGIAFTLGLGGLLYQGGTKNADVINQVLTAALLAVFGVIVLGGTTVADWTELERCDWAVLPEVVPVVFLSLVYHDLVPVLCSYLGGDLRSVRTAILVGSTVPLAMFLSWDAVALCMSHAAAYEDPLHVLMRSGGSSVAALIAIFALLATATSFIGSVLSLSEYAMEQLGFLFSKAADNVRADGHAGKGEESSRRFLGNQDRDGRESLHSRGILSAFQCRSASQPEAASSSLGSYSAAQQQSEANVVALRRDWDSLEPPFPGPLLSHLGERGSLSLSLREGLHQVREWTAGGIRLAGRLAGSAFVEIIRERDVKGGPEGRKSEVAIDRENLRAASYVACLVPPLVISVFNPDAFFAASEAAGAYGMTILYGIFPPAMAWSFRQSQTAASSAPSSADRAQGDAPGGRLALAGMGMCASAVIIGQVMLDTAVIASGPKTEVVLAATEESPSEETPIISLTPASSAPHLIG